MSSMFYYPGALVERLVNHSSPGLVNNKNLIVLHITAGPTARSAINTFQASTTPHRVSAHFVIDRDGTVYQLLPISDVAWHASACNKNSVGIEHAAIPETLPATEAQYEASAKLVAWLCIKLGVQCSRDFIKSHNEASPQDGHVQCCTGALDPDEVVRRAQALS